MVQGSIDMIKKNTEDYWIPLADLMTGMMLIFLLMAVVLINQKPQNVSQNETIKHALYQELNAKFHNYFILWHAKLNESDLSINFTQPEFLFETGKSVLKPEFTAILNKFFPQFVGVVSQAKYLPYLKSIHINGYSSNIWGGVSDPNQAYFLNMELSESRAQQTFKYVYFLNDDIIINSNMTPPDYQKFLQQYITVSGLATKHLVKNKFGKTEQYLSQRVEFKIDI